MFACNSIEGRLVVESVFPVAPPSAPLAAGMSRPFVFNGSLENMSQLDEEINAILAQSGKPPLAPSFGPAAVPSSVPPPSHISSPSSLPSVPNASAEGMSMRPPAAIVDDDESERLWSDIESFLARPPPKVNLKGDSSGPSGPGLPPAVPSLPTLRSQRSMLRLDHSATTKTSVKPVKPSGGSIDPVLLQAALSYKPPPAALFDGEGGEDGFGPRINSAPPVTGLSHSSSGPLKGTGETRLLSAGGGEKRSSKHSGSTSALTATAYTQPVRAKRSGAGAVGTVRALRKAKGGEPAGGSGAAAGSDEESADLCDDDYSIADIDDDLDDTTRAKASSNERLAKHVEKGAEVQALRAALQASQSSLNQSRLAIQQAAFEFKGPK